MTTTDPRAALAAAEAAADDLDDAGGVATRTAATYASVFGPFEGWCEVHGKSALPTEPRDLLRYLAARANAGVGWNQIRLDELGIRLTHTNAGYPSPGRHGVLEAEFKQLIRGIRLADQPVIRAHALTPEDFLTLLALDYRTTTGVRDQTVLSVSRAAGAPIRQAWCALPVAVDDDGVTLLLPSIVGRAGCDERLVVLRPGPGGCLDAHANVLEWAKRANQAEDPPAALGKLVSTRGVAGPNFGPSSWIGQVRTRIGALDLNEVFGDAVGDDAAEGILRRLDQRWLMKLQMDAAIVLLYAGALRGQEARWALVIDWRRTVRELGVTLFIPESKEDQERKGAEVFVPFRFGGSAGVEAVEIVDRWIAAAGLPDHAPILTSLLHVGGDLSKLDPDVPPLTHTTLLRRLAAAGTSAELTERVTGHSGRRGFATSAAFDGADLADIQAHLRHASRAYLGIYMDRQPPEVHARRVAAAMVRAMRPGV